MSGASARDVMWYPTKVDRWFWVLMGLTVLFMLGAMVASLIGGDRSEILISSIAFVLTVGLIAMLAIPVRYGIGQGELIVQFGLFRQRLRFDVIQEVRPTRSMLSAPALSFDRLAVYSGSRYVPAALISPADREGFLDTLAKRAKLRRDGDRLVRDTGYDEGRR